MSGETYAVFWDAPAGGRCAGRLDLDGSGVTLKGAASGVRSEETLELADITSLRLAGGRLHLHLQRGRSLMIGTLDGPGALRELADRLSVRLASA
jgi:hypothetical protein